MQYFSAVAAREISGATQRQLDYWDDRGIVTASIRRKQGKGKERRYSYTDLLKLRVVVELRTAGLSLQKIQKALQILGNWDPNSSALESKKIYTDGREVYVTTSDHRVLKSVLKRGQLVFSVFILGEFVRQTARNIRLYIRRAQAG
ncbi:MAG: MerR family transcriptional regulator [Phycisphaerae bacterium]|nr:MerR family transcriptional regulator [Phycisphaerae bacterium]